MQVNEVINQLIARFEVLFPQLVFRSLRRLPPPQRGDLPYHLVLKMSLQGGKELELGCLVLETGYRDEVERAVRRLTKWRDTAPEDNLSPTLLAPYLGPDEHQLISSHSLNYFDLVGNMNLSASGILIYIDKNLDRPKAEFERVILPFEGKAERVARRLALQPGKTWHMRELAAACEMSLGMASMVTTALVEIGAVTKTRRGISLFNPALLQETWLKAYKINRNPFQVLRCKPNGVTVGDLSKLNSPNWALTLWSGAAVLLGETVPLNRMAFYWFGSIPALMDRLHLGQESGEMTVFVFQPTDPSLLWESKEFLGGIRVVNPLQLYLDLASGDEEELELARRVRSRFLS
ncbi:MAG: hypothetical protein ACYC6L_09635 [Anaerolineae bacterium]